MSLGSLLDEVTVVHDRDGAHDRADVVARADGLAAELAFIEPGQAVAVSLPNTVDVVAALFAVWRLGAVYVPVNPRQTPSEVDRVIATVQPAALVTADGTTRRAGARTYDADVALVQFTSGTTGPPEPVPLQHAGVRTLLDNVVTSLRGGRDRRAPTNLVPVSLSLWAGIYQVLFALRVGAPIVVMERFEPRELARLVAEHGVRSVVLPPAAMAMLADDDTVTSLEPLRFVRSITAPLSPFQARRFQDRFGAIGILNCYGQTEIGGEIVGWTAADWRAHGADKLGAVGRPHAGVEVRTAARTGELEVRTPALGADLGGRMTADGWFRTGDVGRVDDDGFVWIDGRLGDMINRGGLKVFPAEVEEVLRLDPAVADVAVVGVADDRLGEVPWAFVVRAGAGGDRGGDGAVDAGGLARLARRHLAPYKVPVRFVPVDALPRNEVGKVLARELAAMAADGSA